MNKISIVGRLTKDPEERSTSSNIRYCTFSLASRGRAKNENGEVNTDFFNCIAWREKANVILEHCYKGAQVILYGYMASRKYERKDGTKALDWEVCVEDVEFSAGEKAEPTPSRQPQKAVQRSLYELDDNFDDSEMPF